MSDTLDRAFFDVSVDRLARVSPFWIASFRSLSNFPAPQFIAALPGDKQGQLLAHAQATLQTGQSPQAAGLSPDASFFYVLCGLSAQREADMLPHIETLLALHPRDPALLFLRGYAHFCLNQVQAAFRDFCRCHAANERLEHARVALSYLYGLMRDHLQALRMVQPIGSKLQDIMAWWPVVRHLPLICFQAELLITGQSKIGGLDSTLMQSCTADEHRAELAQWLPPTQEICPWEAQPASAYFASCDAVYFHQFAIPLVLSHLESGGSQAFHLHIVNPDARAMEQARALARLCRGRLRVSSETVDVQRYGAPGIYYSCVRFCRLAQFLEPGKTSYLALDADMLINQAMPDSMLAHERSACQLTCVPDEPMWNHFAAGFSIFSAHGSEGQNFLVRLSTFIMRSMQASQSRWFLDQIGLFLSASCTEAQIDLLDHRLYCDLEHRPDSVIWAVTNDKNANRFAERRQVLLDKYAGPGLDSLTPVTL